MDLALVEKKDGPGINFDDLQKLNDEDKIPDVVSHKSFKSFGAALTHLRTNRGVGKGLGIIVTDDLNEMSYVEPVVKKLGDDITFITVN